MPGDDAAPAAGNGAAAGRTAVGTSSLLDPYFVTRVKIEASRLQLTTIGRLQRESGLVMLEESIESEGFRDAQA